MAEPQQPDLRTFLVRADALIRDLLARFDAFDPDELEAETSEGVVKLTFADGSRCVLNRQSAAMQIWLAEGASAWHFVFDPTQGAWLDTRNRRDLFAVLADILTRRLARTVRL